MHTFEVLAPVAEKVEVQCDGKRHLMQRSEDGWWRAEVEAAGPGTDYGFLVDGDGPFPDPRSLWQPSGIDGLSRILDQNAFRWEDAEFHAQPLSRAVIYELHVGTFTPQGTFDAAIQKLEHLAGLGITHVELMPVNTFSGDHGWGYDGVDLFAPHSAYGGPEGLKRFVNACHRGGMAALLDVVYNHLGPSGNQLSKFAPLYFNARYHTPWGAAINFDGPDSDQVRRFFCDNALMWLRDYHFDGLRLDAVHAILDTSARPFLEQLGDEVKRLAKQLDRPLVVTAESDLNDPRLLWPVERGGFALDAQWSDDFHHALHAVLTRESNGYYADFGRFEDLAKALRKAFVYDGRHSLYRRRAHGRPPVGLSGHHFLAYAQNHDQVGNRAHGERLSGLVSLGRLKIAAACVLTSPFVPMLFQGEEWGASTPFQYFTDHRDPKLANAVREGRRGEFAAFGWNPLDVPDPQARETFIRSKLKWEELTRAPHSELLEWHRRLIQLRGAEPALGNGRLDLVQVSFDEAARWFVFSRESIAIAFNLGDEPRRVPLGPTNHKILLASDPRIELAGGCALLPRDSVVLLAGQTPAERRH